MTIALGVIAADGVVLAADTEETDGYLKTGQSKISTAMYQNAQEPVHSHCACGISGAGMAGHIDFLTEKLSNAFLDNAIPQDGEPRRALAAEIATFYREHVVPFAGYPEHERPDVSMLLALSLGPYNRQILISDKTTLRRGGAFAAVGIGAMFARLVLKELWHEGMGVKSAAWLAAYAVWQTKEAVPNCGKFTEILVLSKGEAAYVPWKDMRQMEESFPRVLELQRLLFHHAIGSTETSGMLGKWADELRTECGLLLTDLLPIQMHPLLVRPPARKDGVQAHNWRLDLQPKSKALMQPKTTKPKRQPNVEQPDEFIDRPHMDVASRLANRVQLSSDGWLTACRPSIQHSVSMWISEQSPNVLGSWLGRALLASQDGQREAGDDYWRTESAPHLDVARRAPESYDADVHAPLHQTDERIQQEDRDARAPMNALAFI